MAPRPAAKAIFTLRKVRGTSDLAMVCQPDFPAPAGFPSTLHECTATRVHEKHDKGHIGHGP